MPKRGMEPIRRRALIEAAIETIGTRGSLDVTMGDIAKRAGVSAGLAHHYFGGKDRLILATMRHLLIEFRRSLVARLRSAATPRARVSAIVGASFGSEQFEPATVTAWLSFYVRAREDAEARRLHRVYASRLASNLTHALVVLVGERTVARRIAEGAAALIDGLYVREALKPAPSDPTSAVALVEDYVDAQLWRATRAEAP